LTIKVLGYTVKSMNVTFTNSELKYTVKRAAGLGADRLPLDITPEYPYDELAIKPSGDARRKGRVTLSVTVEPPSLILTRSQFADRGDEVSRTATTFVEGYGGGVEVEQRQWQEVGGEPIGTIPTPQPVDFDMRQTLGRSVMTTLDRLV
jgi:hypothetical protein